MKLSMVILAVAITLPLGCARTPEVFEPRVDLLVSWSSQAQDRMPEPPYVAMYERGEKTLRYLASTHQHRAPNPVFEMIDRELDEMAPQAIVIEGIPADLGSSPQGFPTDCEVAFDSGVWPSGEAGYAACRARERAIPFTGAEPSPADVLSLLPRSGFTVRDLLYYYVVRQIGVWRRTGELDERSFEALFEEFIDTWAPPHRQDPSSFSSADFAAWYCENNGEPFAPETLPSSVSAPMSGPDALFTQRVSDFVDRVRNTVIVQTIASMLQAHDRVLVVYGAGHHVQQAPVLEEMLGPAL